MEILQFTILLVTTRQNFYFEDISVLNCFALQFIRFVLSCITFQFIKSDSIKSFHIGADCHRNVLFFVLGGGGGCAKAEN